MLYTYLSALRSLQAKMWKGKHTDEPLGHTSQYLEDHGGGEGGQTQRSTDQEAAATAVRLLNHYRTMQVHKGGSPPCSHEADCN